MAFSCSRIRGCGFGHEEDNISVFGSQQFAQSALAATSLVALSRIKESDTSFERRFNRRLCVTFPFGSRLNSSEIEAEGSS